MATPTDAAISRWGSLVAFSLITTCRICPGLSSFMPSCGEMSLQCGGKIDETRTRLYWAMPALRSAISKLESFSRCLPTPLVRKIFLATKLIPGSRARTYHGSGRASSARPSLHDREQLAGLDRLPGLHPELAHGTGSRAGDLVLHLHGLDHQQAAAGFDRRPDLDEHRHHLPRHARPYLALAGVEPAPSAPAERALVEEAKPVGAAAEDHRPGVAARDQARLGDHVIDQKGEARRPGGMGVDDPRSAVDGDLVAPVAEGDHLDRPPRLADERDEPRAAAQLRHGAPRGGQRRATGREPRRRGARRQPLAAPAGAWPRPRPRRSPAGRRPGRPAGRRGGTRAR